MYDLIGDIHGYASVLKKLLKKLGYKWRSGVFRHSNRKVIFVGDYIDRGPEIRETIYLIRSMVDAGEAIALMGNHEYNAIMYNEPDGSGGYLRPHTSKNKKQHLETLQQFEGKENDYHNIIQWFKELPIFFEDDEIRAIHACWDQQMVEELKNYTSDNVLKNPHIQQAGQENTRLYTLMDDLLKGKEVALPVGITFRDKDGHERTEMRVRWWLNPEEVSFREWSINRDINGLNEMKVPQEFHDIPHYEEDRNPVFFGHYWLHGTPGIQRSNVCCLDYSIGKQDKLVAYRFNGEQELDSENLVWADYKN